MGTLAFRAYLQKRAWNLALRPRTEFGQDEKDSQDGMKAGARQFSRPQRRLTPEVRHRFHRWLCQVFRLTPSTEAAVTGLHENHRRSTKDRQSPPPHVLRRRRYPGRHRTRAGRVARQPDRPGHADPKRGLPTRQPLRCRFHGGNEVGHSGDKSQALKGHRRHSVECLAWPLAGSGKSFGRAGFEAGRNGR